MKWIKVNVKSVYYRKCLVYIQVVGLLILYASGNYFVVQKFSNELHHLPLDSNDPLPFGWFFWTWTIILPFVYIAFSLKWKSIIALRIGLITAAAAAYSFQTYYHLVPLEYALVIFGTALLFLVVCLIKHLNAPKAGFTYAQRRSRHWTNDINLESLVVSGAASATSAVPDHSSSRFGGGDFGGGGSSGNF